MTDTNPARIIFDLDGTLVDSLGSLAGAGARLLREMDREPLPVAGFERFVGRGVRALVLDMLGETGGVPDDPGKAVDRFHAIYAEDPVIGVAEYPGARDALLELAERGCALGVCTQKPEAQARRILQALGMMPPIMSLIGGDTLTGILKPDPKMLHAAADPLGTGPLVYVGDSSVDAKTAANAKVPFILTQWGYRSETPEQLPHDRLLKSFDALPDLISGLIADK